MDYVNLVTKRARFDDMTVREICEFSRLYQNMIEHCKKCEAHIFEHVATIEKDAAIKPGK